MRSDKVYGGAIETVKRIKEFVGKIIIGNTQPIDLLLATIIAGGHALITGPIGSGKTTLARAFAKAIGGTFSRVQMSNETLPSDILGFVIYTRDGGAAHIVKGGPYLQISCFLTI